MRVLTFANNILTVIREGDFFSGQVEKPEFITGDNFYYEPNHEVMDDKALDADMIISANNFIDQYVFIELTPEIIPEPVLVNCVDKRGNYLGLMELTDDLIEVPNVPIGEISFPIWDFIEGIFYDAVVIDKETLGYKGIFKLQVDIDNLSNLEYAYKSNYDFEICSACQKYNKLTKIFDTDISVMVKTKTGMFVTECMNELIARGGDFGNIANAVYNSWLRQETEAKAWVLDNNVATPFIDFKLIGRAIVGETKEGFINKILTKAASYHEIYGIMLGKLDSKIKLLEAATTRDEIKNIVW